jgi:hypothetical protein
MLTPHHILLLVEGGVVVFVAQGVVDLVLVAELCELGFVQEYAH